MTHLKPKHMRYAEWTGALTPDTEIETGSDSESKAYLAQPGKSEQIFVAMLGRRADNGSRPVPLDIPRKPRRIRRPVGV